MSAPGGGPLESYAHDGLRFDVTDRGPRDGPPVIALHGFPEDRHCWDGLAERLVAAGHRVLAPDQRGYSPGARPAGRAAYTVERLSADVLALADAAGTGRFHLVGHDWGAAVAWSLAGHHPERLLSLTALSVPHPGAVLRSLTRSDQLLRSWYMGLFQVPRLPELLMGRGGGSALTDGLVRIGLDRDTAVRYARRAAEPGGLTGPLNWYRALPLQIGPGRPPRVPAVAVPTLYVWGDRDRYVSRAAAAACCSYVTASCRFIALPGRTHWLPTAAVEDIAPAIIDHLGAPSR